MTVTRHDTVMTMTGGDPHQQEVSGVEAMLGRGLGARGVQPGGLHRGPALLGREETRMITISLMITDHLPYFF